MKPYINRAYDVAVLCFIETLPSYTNLHTLLLSYLIIGKTFLDQLEQLPSLKDLSLMFITIECQRTSPLALHHLMIIGIEGGANSVTASLFPPQELEGLTIGYPGIAEHLAYLNTFSSFNHLTTLAMWLLPNALDGFLIYSAGAIKATSIQLWILNATRKHNPFA